MKKNIFIFLLCASSALFAQKNINLETVIPSSTNMVFRLNGKEIAQKIGIKNIVKSQSFLKMIEGEIFLGNENKRIGDLGINLENDVFIIYEANRNISYTAYLYHIEKPKLFAKYIAEKNEFVETVKTDNYTVIHYKKGSSYYDDTRDFLAWNKEYAIYFDISYVKDFVDVEVDNESRSIESDRIDNVVEEVEYVTDEPDIEMPRSVEEVIVYEGEVEVEMDYEAHT